METFSALLAICAGNSPATGEFLAQWPVTRSFDIFFDMCMNKRLSKQSWGWWFETPSRPLWRQCTERWLSSTRGIRDDLFRSERNSRAYLLSISHVWEPYQEQQHVWSKLPFTINRRELAIYIYITMNADIFRAISSETLRLGYIVLAKYLVFFFHTTTTSSFRETLGSFPFPPILIEVFFYWKWHCLPWQILHVYSTNPGVLAQIGKFAVVDCIKSLRAVKHTDIGIHRPYVVVSCNLTFFKTFPQTFVEFSVFKENWRLVVNNKPLYLLFLRRQIILQNTEADTSMLITGAEVTSYAIGYTGDSIIQ